MKRSLVLTIQRARMRLDRRKRAVRYAQDYIQRVKRNKITLSSRLPVELLRRDGFWFSVAANDGHPLIYYEELLNLVVEAMTMLMRLQTLAIRTGALPNIDAVRLSVDTSMDPSSDA